MNVGSDELVPLLATSGAEAEVERLLAKAEALGLTDEDPETAMVPGELEFAVVVEEPVAEDPWKEEQVGAEAWSQGWESAVPNFAEAEVLDEADAPHTADGPQPASVRAASWREVSQQRAERPAERCEPRRPQTSRTSSREVASLRRWLRVAAVGLLMVVLVAALGSATGVGVSRPGAPRVPAAQAGSASAAAQVSSVSGSGARRAARERTAARERARARRAEREAARARAALRRRAAEARRLRVQVRRATAPARKRSARRASAAAGRSSTRRVTAAPHDAALPSAPGVRVAAPAVRRAVAPSAAVQAQRALSPDFSK